MSIRIGGYLPKSSDLIEADKLQSCPMKLIHEDPITKSRVRQAVHQAILDGYTSIVYNFVRSGDTQLTESDRCIFQPFDLEELWKE
jgi:hypothetical protein